MEEDLTYYERNKERLQRAGREYHWKNREKQNKYCKTYYQENKERILERNRKKRQGIPIVKPVKPKPEPIIEVPPEPEPEPEPRWQPKLSDFTVSFT